jgi:hypothetical protein
MCLLPATRLGMDEPARTGSGYVRARTEPAVVRAGVKQKSLRLGCSNVSADTVVPTCYQTSKHNDAATCECPTRHLTLMTL